MVSAVRRKAPGWGRRGPATVRRGQRRHLSVGNEPPAALSKAAEIALMQLMDVDIHRVGFVHRADDLIRPQHGNQHPRLGRIEPADPQIVRRQLRPRRGKRLLLTRHGEHQRATRRQDWVFGKAVGPGLVERAARPGEDTDGAVAIGLGEQSRRAAGAVIARLALALEQDDAAVGGEMRRHGCASDAGADDDYVGRFGQCGANTAASCSCARCSARPPRPNRPRRSAR
jgi:hypothetical protein